MLMEANSSQQQRANSMSPSDTDRQQYQTQAMAGQRQHEALASLFRSLSSLANGNSRQQQQQQQQPLDIPHCQASSLNLTSNATGVKGMASPPDATSIASSIQSVVAAAVMQQQLVTEAISRRQQQQQQHHHQLAPPMLPPSAQINASHNSGGPNAELSAYLADQMRPVGYPFLEQQKVPQALPGLEEDVQFPTGATNLAISSNINNNNNNNQQNQRINYCTICNKELCNKYFMKTHMLKMHGINLEMEQQSASSENNDAQKADGSPPVNQIRSADEEANDEGGHQSAECTSNSANCSVDAEQQPCSASNDQKRPAKTAPAGKQTGASKQTARSTSQAGGSKSKSSTAPMKQATSVMNGFAGNSMGGVVCDICNKELCSKYFLKVHKQNTHGIMTDYQDASQFVYPFVNPLATSNPFIAPAITLNQAANVLPLSSVCFGQPSGQSQPVVGCQQQVLPAYNSVGPSGPKRVRSLATEKQQPQQQSKPESNSTKSRAPPKCPSEFVNEAADDKPFDPFYRLMVAQQQQRQQPKQQPQMSLQPNFEPINQMSAMMCYGAMNPFGPAGVSPTMIVEMILRNQHLFNRHTNNNRQQQQANQGKGPKEKDSNNNGDSKQKSAAKVNSKEANGNRYFTHYTEACPMCDRRFKSIKWLKTHMMNDHKQEIGAYMQMMMQSMCSVKSQTVSEQQFQLEPSPCCSSFAACAQQQAKQQHQKQLYQPPVSFCANSSQAAAPLGPVGPSGVLQTMQNDQFSLIQSYLIQQRQVLERQQQQHNQGLMDFSSPESNQARLTTLNNLNASRDVISSSSSAKTSPRSTTSVLNEDEPQVDQLDLSIKYNSDSRSCVLNSGGDFLQADSQPGLGRTNEFSDDEDTDCSMSPSSRHESGSSDQADNDNPMKPVQVKAFESV